MFDVFNFQFTLPHSRGSSHGAVRIICYPYTDPRRQAAMPEQHQMWSQLEKELSTTLTQLGFVTKYFC